MLLLVLLLPSKHDRSVAGWWGRVRTQAKLTMRVVLALAIAAGVTWYVLLPILGWIQNAPVRPGVSASPGLAPRASGSTR